MTVDPAVDVQHHHRAEALRVVLERRLHVGIDVLLFYLLGDQSLGLGVERVGRHHPHAHTFTVCTRLLLLVQNGREPFCRKDGNGSMHNGTSSRNNRYNV